MKLRIERGELLRAVQGVQGVLKTRTTLPILSSVLLMAEGEQLTVTGTDLDTSIKATGRATVLEAGAVCIPARRLLEVAQFSTGPEFEISIDGKNEAEVVCGKSRFRLHGLPFEEFPSSQKVTGKTVVMEQAKLKAMLRGTVYAQSDANSGSYIRESIYFGLNGEMSLVACESHRLAVATGEKCSEAGEWIVPTKAVAELCRMVADEGQVEMVLGDNWALFKLNGLELATKLIEGNYPNYKQVIPGNVKHRIRIKREDFIEVLRRALVVLDDKTFCVKLRFSKNAMEVSAQSAGGGSMCESVECDYGGVEESIGFNPHYLLDFLRATDEAVIEFELIDGLSPAVLRVPGVLNVVMPMRLS